MNWLFLPIALLYAIVVRVRNWLFDMRLLPVCEPSIPTICVGNIAVGGTGKTPHVEWLIRLLSPHYKVAVLSRGYKRKTRGFYMADAHSTVQQLGDECLQIHSKYPTIPLAVDENRVRGIRLLRQHHSDLQVIILDDAMQYRSLQAGFTIMLTTADRLFYNDHFLPVGRLRDNIYRSQHADVVLVTNCPPTLTPIDKRAIIHDIHPLAFQQVGFSSIQYQPLSSVANSLPESSSVLLLTGIANPHYLMNYLQQKFSHVQHLDFPDHHTFTSADIVKLEKLAKNVKRVFTTEKDWMRLATSNISKELRGKIEPITIQVKVDCADGIEEQIKRYLQKCIF